MKVKVTKGHDGLKTYHTYHIAVTLSEQEIVQAKSMQAFRCEIAEYVCQEVKKALSPAPNWKEINHSPDALFTAESDWPKWFYKPAPKHKPSPFADLEMED